MSKNPGLCPLYNNDASGQEKAHGSACGSPVCNPNSDCCGSITNSACTVPAFVWKKIALSVLNNEALK